MLFVWLISFLICINNFFSNRNVTYSLISARVAKRGAVYPFFSFFYLSIANLSCHLFVFIYWKCWIIKQAYDCLKIQTLDSCILGSKCTSWFMHFPAQVRQREYKLIDKLICTSLDQQAERPARVGHCTNRTKVVSEWIEAKWVSERVSECGHCQRAAACRHWSNGVKINLSRKQQPVDLFWPRTRIFHFIAFFKAI